MVFNIDSLPYVAASHQTPRGDAIDGACVHTNEGPIGPNAADNLADYLHSPGVEPGYHVIVGGKGSLGGKVGAIRLAQDSQRVNGAGGVNDRTLNICLIGRAAFTRDQWLNNPDLRAEIDVASDIVRQWSVRHNFPFRKITADEVSHKVPGVWGHGDVRDPRSAGHTDPGAGFPWDVFMSGAAPTPKPTIPEDEVQFFYRNPDGGAVYFVAGNTRAHQSPDQRDIYIVAAKAQGTKIPDLGDLSPAQLKAMDRVPLVGPA